MIRAKLALPCLLGALLLADGASAANALVAPPGYYAPVHIRDGKEEHCAAVPTPYTDKLFFRSKYEGSDSARANLNTEAEQAFRVQTANITTLERGVARMVTRYMERGQPAYLECALSWMSTWAEAGALLSTDFNHTGKSMRKWALGSMAGAYLQLKFSSSQPLKPYPREQRLIEDWFARLGEQVVRDWSGLPLKRINNHSYWAAWSVMATAVALDRRDLFDWAVKELHIGADQVDGDGFLPNELRRRQRALAYHNYSLPPLMMLAVFARTNGVDLRDENNAALSRLASRVLAGAENPEPFARRTESQQYMDDLHDDYKLSWLEPYCNLYVCSPALRKKKTELGPFNSFRLGGDVTRIFDSAAARPALGKRD